MNLICAGTQSQFGGTAPLIRLDGFSAGPGANGLTFESGTSKVLDLSLNDFSGSGLLLDGLDDPLRVHNVDIQGGGTGVSVNGGSGSLMTHELNISDTGSNGIDVQNSNGSSFSFGGSNLTTPDGSAFNIENSKVFDWEMITPRINVNYALGQERKKLLPASFSRFPESMAFTGGKISHTGESGFDFGNINGTVSINSEAWTMNNLSGWLGNVSNSNSTFTFSGFTSTRPTEDGIDLNNNSGTLKVSGTASIDSTGAPAVDIDSTDLDVTFTQLSSMNRAGFGINITDSSGSLTIDRIKIDNSTNRRKIFGDPGLTVQEGVNNLEVNVPDSAQLGQKLARFRLSRDGGLEADGPDTSGEVEDYVLSVIEPNPDAVAIETFGQFSDQDTLEGDDAIVDDDTGTNTVSQLTEGSDAVFTRTVDLPAGTESATLQYRFTLPSVEDRVVISIDDVEIFSATGSGVQGLPG